MEKILTISIAAYNAENDIQRCLDSLIKSGVLEQLDIIVVNDGSKDRTSEIVSDYVEKYKTSIRLVNKENGGHGSTINCSIKRAIGKYYKILDSDDWVDSVNLAKLVELLSTIDTDMVLNPYVEVNYDDHKKQKLVIPDNKRTPKKLILSLESLTNDITLYMHSLTFNTNIVKKMGSIIDENCFYVDMEYCVFPMLYVNNFVSLDYPVYQYLLGSQTQSMNWENLIKRRNQHLKVTKRLVEFYDKFYQDVDSNIRELMSLRIKYAVYQQYKIYLSMPAKESFAEIKEFDAWIHEKNAELYAGPEGRIMQFIKLNRKSNYRFYICMVNIAKKLGMVQ